MFLLGMVGTKIAVVPSALRMNQVYVTWAWAFFTCRYYMCITIVHVILIGFLPMMVLSMLNIKVYMTMQMMRQRLEAKRMNRDDGRFTNNKRVQKVIFFTNLNTKLAFVIERQIAGCSRKSWQGHLRKNTKA